MTLTLTTFGTCRLEDEVGQVVQAPALSLVLLAYLYDVGRSAGRRELANFLWPDSGPSAATNLRSVLHRLSVATASAPRLLESDGTALSVHRDVLQCDLGFAELDDPLARLRAATDAVAMQFLPLLGKGTAPLDIWVRDVRARMAGRLRAEYVKVEASMEASRGRSELRRAAILLLEWDPNDDDVRKSLAEEPQRFRRPSAVIRMLHDNPEPGRSGSAPPPPGSVVPRIALLPPETLKDAQRRGSIANALIEDLTIELCASRAVSVVAPYTSERIRASKDKADILQQHRVMYALDTKRSDDWLFVQLIYLPLDEVVWATRFQLAQHAVAEQRAAISGAIQQSIIDRIGARGSLVRHFDQKPEAYFSYLRGLHDLSNLTLPSIRRSRRHFREALGQDRKFAAALSGVSRTLTMEWVLTARGDKDLLDQAEKFAGMAIEENGEFAGGYKELGVSQLYRGRIDESLAALGQAEALSPHYADALWSHADSLVHASNPGAALTKVTSAIDLNPLSPDTYFWTAAGASYFLREYSQALAYVDRMQDSGPAARLAAACWGMLGDTAKARACRMRVLKNNPDFDLERWLDMIPHKEPWQTELYREGLVKAGF